MQNQPWGSKYVGDALAGSVAVPRAQQATSSLRSEGSQPGMNMLGIFSRSLGQNISMAAQVTFLPGTVRSRKHPKLSKETQTPCVVRGSETPW